LEMRRRCAGLRCCFAVGVKVRWQRVGGGRRGGVATGVLGGPGGMEGLVRIQAKGCWWSHPVENLTTY
jgi:hypothetical protein